MLTYVETGMLCVYFVIIAAIRPFEHPIETVRKQPQRCRAQVDRTAMSGLGAMVCRRHH